MQRRAALILSFSILIIGALACNFPGASPRPEITETAIALITATANRDATIVAGLTALAITQTSNAPAATDASTEPATQSASATATPTTPAPAGAAAATAAATGAATTAPTASGSATQTSVAKGALKVGVEANIVTTGGTPLNIRDNPGKKAKVVTALPGDSRVKIIDGPKAADNLLWWKVQVLTSSASDAPGKQGWVVEYIDGGQTLVAAK